MEKRRLFLGGEPIVAAMLAAGVRDRDIIAAGGPGQATITRIRRGKDGVRSISAWRFANALARATLETAAPLTPHAVFVLFSPAPVRIADVSAETEAASC